MSQIVIPFVKLGIRFFTLGHDVTMVDTNIEKRYIYKTAFMLNIWLHLCENMHMALFLVRDGLSQHLSAHPGSA